MTPLEFCIHALRVNGGAPCDLECAANAEAELKVLLDDRASIDAMTTLLAKARNELDRAFREVDALNLEVASLQRQLAASDTRIKLLEEEIEYKNEQINRSR